MTTVTVLDREMYAEPHAARLLGVAPATLHYWLEGGVRRSKTYKPVIREEATGSKVVTWAEFIEAGLLRQYRKDLNVPMVELRAFISRLRQQFGVPYPLAHESPFALGRELVSRAQDEVGLDGEFALVAQVRDQYILAPAAEAFVRSVRWTNQQAAAWRPAVDLPVVIDPEVRFGAPSIGGISTSILWEQIQGGEDMDDVAEVFGLTLAQVNAAISYEARQAA